MARPARADLEALPADLRQQLWDAHRQRPFQAITSVITALGVLLGVAFTAFGLVYTARTLAATQEGQITDRYTKAAEQLGSKSVDVRLAALYALRRIAGDSSRDRLTIRDVIAAFVRNHDLCAAPKPPKQCSAGFKPNPKDSPVSRRLRVAVDVQAALTIAYSLTSKSERQAGHYPDFSRVRFPYVDLSSAVLNWTDLSHANLNWANLGGAYLHSAHLEGAELRSTNLVGANLGGAYLDNAKLRGANLSHAYLGGASLTNTDLRGANLTYVSGMSVAEIRDVAITDDTTKFWM